MIHLPSQAVSEFQELYFQKYGIKLTSKKAEIKAKDFYTLYSLSQQENIL